MDIGVKTYSRSYGVTIFKFQINIPVEESDDELKPCKM